MEIDAKAELGHDDRQWIDLSLSGEGSTHSFILTIEEAQEIIQILTEAIQAHQEDR